MEIQSTICFERQVDTGEWAQIAKTSATKYTDVCPSSGTNVNYRVKANDRKGGESDYRTGTAKAIVYNQPPFGSGVYHIWRPARREAAADHL